MCWMIAAPSRKKSGDSFSPLSKITRARTAETDGRVVLMHDIVAGAVDISRQQLLRFSFYKDLTASEFASCFLAFILLTNFGLHLAN